MNQWHAELWSVLFQANGSIERIKWDCIDTSLAVHVWRLTVNLSKSRMKMEIQTPIDTHDLRFAIGLTIIYTTHCTLHFPTLGPTTSDCYIKWYSSLFRLHSGWCSELHNFLVRSIEKPPSRISRYHMKHTRDEGKKPRLKAFWLSEFGTNAKNSLHNNFYVTNKAIAFTLCMAIFQRWYFWKVFSCTKLAIVKLSEALSEIEFVNRFYVNLFYTSLKSDISPDK